MPVVLRRLLPPVVVSGRGSGSAAAAASSSLLMGQCGNDDSLIRSVTDEATSLAKDDAVMTAPLSSAAAGGDCQRRTCLRHRTLVGISVTA